MAARPGSKGVDAPQRPAVPPPSPTTLLPEKRRLHKTKRASAQRFEPRSRPIDSPTRAAPTTADMQLRMSPAPDGQNEAALFERASPTDQPSIHASRRTPAAPSAPAFDPSLADRLADEVIHRIERRARIERERRGL
ncbi:hypothetical protein [Lysobacter rhizosphaerae]